MPLWTKNFILACLANFLLYFAFYMLLPTLPLYLIETFDARPGLVGTVLSSYIAAALIIRPFSGYLLDSFSRKPLYFLSYLLFVAVFAGYLAAGTLMAFTLYRILHGFTFGTVSVAGATVIIDILPSSRRGEGLGYFGITNNLAMAFGPMAGLMLNDATGSFSAIFLLSLFSGSLGVVCVYLLHIEPRPKVKHARLSLDRFFLLNGIPACINILLLGIPYAMMTTYVALYAQQLGIGSAGLFFTLLAVGLIGSRLFSGARVDKGQISVMILLGIVIVTGGYMLFASLEGLQNAGFLAVKPLFFGSALIFGIGYGTMFPAFNTLFVQLAHNHQRGTAMSTYLTGWDLGTSIGLLAGGFIAQSFGFHVNYMFSVGLCIGAWLLFRYVTGSHFAKNKVAD